MSVVVALDFINNAQTRQVPPVCVISGDEAFLRSLALSKLRELVLSDQDAEYSLSRFDGNETSFPDVLRETSMIPLFGSGKRLVVVDQAETFISQNKEKLEEYLTEPNKAGILALVAASFPSNLRLYKKVAEKGLVVDCKSLPPRGIPSWLLGWASRRCHVSLSRESAKLLVELVGDDLGALDQETRRLALLAPDGKINVDLVREQVGSWRQRKVWDLVDAALDGKTAEALRQLDKLVAAGEAPIAILAQTSATLRKLAAACETLREAEDDSDAPRPTISAVLDQIGVRSFLKTKTTEQLKKLGAKRGARLAQDLLEADLNLKGGSRGDPRFALERFIVQISSPQMRSFDSLR